MGQAGMKVWVIGFEEEPMDIKEVRRLVEELYPELQRTELDWDKVYWNKEEESKPPCWHLYTYLDSKLGLLGIETIFRPRPLAWLSKHSIEVLVKGLRSAFAQKLEELK